MARGFLSGAILGLGVFGAGATIMAAVSGPPIDRQIGDVAKNTAQPLPVETEVINEPEVVTEDSTVAETVEPEVAEVVTPEPEVIEPEPEVVEVRTPEPEPEVVEEVVENVTAEPEAEAAEQEQAEMVASEPEVASDPEPTTEAEATPVADPEPVAEVVPTPAADPEAVAEVEPVTVADPEPVDEAEPTPAVDPEPEVEVAEATETEAPQPPIEPEVEVAEPSFVLIPDEATVSPVQPAAEPEVNQATPQQTPEPETEIAVDDTPAALPEVAESEAEAAAGPAPATESEVVEADPEANTEVAEEVASAETEVIVEEETSGSRPRVIQIGESSLPGKAATSRASQSSRLPTIGQSSETEQNAAGSDMVSKSGRALDDFAVSFQNPQNNPLFSVMLMDDGSAKISSDMVKNFQHPVTFVVDATRGDASDRAAAFRKAGFEVAMLTNLPADATAADIEVTFESYRAAVPEAVAVFEMDGNGFQSKTRLVSQLVQILESSGHGLVTISSGLNSAQRVAQQEGLPNASVFRDISQADGMAVRRTLDSAAFRAGRDGNVVVIAQMTPTVMTALTEWSHTSRAETVAIAPLSAVLKQ